MGWLATWKEVTDSWKVALPVTCAAWAPGQERPVSERLVVCTPISFWLMSSSDSLFCRARSGHGREPFGLWTESQSSLPSFLRRRADGEGRRSPGASTCGAQAGPHKQHGGCRSRSLIRELRARCPSPSQGSSPSAPSWVTTSVSSLSSQTHPSLHLFASFTLQLSSLPVPIPCSFLLLVWKHPDTVLELPAQPCLRTTHGVPCCPETSQGLGWLQMPTHICLWWHTL